MLETPLAVEVLMWVVSVEVVILRRLELVKGEVSSKRANNKLVSHCVYWWFTLLPLDLPPLMNK